MLHKYERLYISTYDVKFRGASVQVVGRYSAIPIVGWYPGGYTLSLR